MSTYLPLLAWKGKIIQVGLAMEPHEVVVSSITLGTLLMCLLICTIRNKICFQIVQLSMIFKMITIAGSVTGGMAATQECIDCCAEKGIEPEIELGCNPRSIELTCFFCHGQCKKRLVLGTVNPASYLL